MSVQNCFLCFDIETIPCLETAAALLEMEGSPDNEVLDALKKHTLDTTKGEFHKTCFQKVVAISVMTGRIEKTPRQNEVFKLTSLSTLGAEDSSEEELLKSFWGAVCKNTPRLVSYSGRNFDIPVLLLRAMRYGINCSEYFNLGDKWNSYVSRYSSDYHCDLPDSMSSFGSSSKLKLTELCALVGLPGKIGVDGSDVHEYWTTGRKKEVRDYCETDVVNTMMGYLSWQLLQGKILKSDLDSFTESLVDVLNERPHFTEFLKKWGKDVKKIEEAPF